MESVENNVSLKKVKKSKKNKQSKTLDKIKILDSDIMDDKNIEILTESKIIVSDESDSEIVNKIEVEKIALDVLDSISGEDEIKKKEIEDRILEEENRRWQEEEDETDRLLELERQVELAKEDINSVSKDLTGSIEDSTNIINEEETVVNSVDIVKEEETVVNSVDIVKEEEKVVNSVDNVVNITENLSLTVDEEKEINSLVNNLIKEKTDEPNEPEVKHKRFFTRMTKQTKVLMAGLQR